MRDDKDPNTVVFMPDANDTSRWENGPDYIVVDSQDVTEQWYYKFNPDGSIDFSYCYKNQTRYDYVYNGTFDNGTEIPVDVIITVDTNLTTTRKLFSIIPPQIEPLDSSSLEMIPTNVDSDGRRLFSVENSEDCLLAALCTFCEMFWSKQKEKIKSKAEAGTEQNDSHEGRELFVPAALRSAVAVAIKICDKISELLGKINQFSEVIPIPLSVQKVCDALDPCKWFCPPQTNYFDGTTFVSCFDNVECIFHLHRVL